MKTLIHSILIFCVGFISPLSPLQAGIEAPIQSNLAGTNFIPSSNPVSIVNGNIPGYSHASFNPAWMQNFDLVAVTNLLKLYLDQNAEVYIDFGFKLKLPLSITYYESNSPAALSISGQSLEITYDPNLGTNFQQMDVFRFYGGCETEVEIDPSAISLTDLSGGPLTIAQEAIVSQIVHFQSEIIVERYYQFDPLYQHCLANFSCTVLNTTLANELIICFDPIQGAESYQIEWIFVDHYDGNGGSIAPNNLRYDFRQNAARVEVSEPKFILPLTFEAGWLLYRVRGIGRNPADFSKALIGAWSCGYTGCPTSCQSEQGLVGQYLTKELLTPHENDQHNWQVLSTYAEDGKHKELVSYMDGTNRNRQTVTGLSTDRMTLVAEQFYDSEGRVAIQALPAPVADASLRFYDNFNQNIIGSPYNRDNFDLTNASCNSVAEPMLDTHSGVANYFSPNNPDLNGFNAFLPDAEGYPFSQIRYTPDNTGRISSEGGLGPMHQLESSHETKFFYGTPFQEELDRTFGSNAGEAAHYKKNMVIDANGQISVNYIDLQGNTIATALAGNPPDNLEALDSYTQEQMFINLMANNVQDDQAYSLTTHFTHLVNTQSNYDFHYTMEGLKYRDQTCMAQNVCYDCVYDLEILIVDEQNCGDTLFLHQETIGKLFIPKLDPITGNPVIVDRAPVMLLNTYCIYAAGPYSINNPPQPEYGSADIQFSVNLDVGSYTIIKKLTVNEQAADTYVDHFLNDPSNICSQTFEDFLAEELANIDTTACKIDCDDAETDANNPNYTASLSAEEMDDLTALMEDLCEQSQSQCAAIREGMLADVSPFGQYGFAPINGLSPAHPYDPKLSVFLPNNVLPEINGWSSYRDPNLIFPDQNGSPMMVQNTNGNMVPVNHSSIPLSQFIDNWRDEWAEVLLRFHPEKCYLDFCETYLGNSEDRNAILLTTNTYDDALVAGFISTSDPLAIMASDPLLNANFPTNILPLNLSVSTWLTNKLNNFVTDPNTNISLSLKQFAISNANCPNAPLTCSNQQWGLDPTTKDQEWQIYRSLYISVKEELLYKLRTTYAINNGCYNGCIGADPFKILQENFWDPFDQHHPDFVGDPFSSPDQYCNNTQYFYFKEKSKRFPSVYDILPQDFTLDFFDGDPSQILDELGEDYAELAAECCNDTTRLAGLADLFQQMYNQFQNGNNYVALDDLNLPDDLVSLFAGIAVGPNGPSVLIQGDDNGYTIQLDTALCKLNFKFPDPATPTLISSVSGFTLINNSSTGTNFQFIATFGGGTDIIVEGYLDPSCDFLCPELPLSCPPTDEAEELLGLWNHLLNDNSFTNAASLTDPWPGDALQAYFGNVSPMVWSSSNCFDNHFTLLSPNDNCSFSFDLPPNFDWADAVQFLSLLPDQNQLDNNNHTQHFIAQLQMQDGTIINLSGENECFAMSYCCTEPQSLNDNNIQARQGSNRRRRPLRLKLRLFKGIKGIMKKQPLPAEPVQQLREKYIKDCEDCDIVSLTGGVLGDLSSTHCEDGCDPVEPESFDLANTCVDQLIDIATHNAEIKYQAYLEELATNMKEAYMQKCLEAAETFDVNYFDSQHHFTLYYFDQPGNLVQTVPPEGVSLLSPAQVAQVQAHRDGLSPNPLYPNHGLQSEYRYNSLEQLRIQQMPDQDGNTRFYYDRLGRIVGAISPEQQALGYRFTYTLYDGLGRVSESGESHFPFLAGNITMANFLVLVENFSSSTVNWPILINYGTKSQITRTQYDQPINNTIAGLFPNGTQDNLRGRVASVMYFEQDLPSPESATHFSYDVHGNGKTIIQDYLGFGQKIMVYDYDQISGNVNQLHYQPGEDDQFYHRYSYDADNRITAVQTSLDGVIWEEDAHYDYYHHGPQARIELGADSVQGLDFANTIHGWLKGMNSGSLIADYDMGQDGKASAANKLFAKDVVGFILDYYEDQSNNVFDYTAIGNAVQFVPQSANSQFGDAMKPLYNGNIRRMSTAIEPFMNTGNPMGAIYGYDQLNRLIRMNGYLQGFDATSNSWQSGTFQPAYASRYAYDANGNIVGLKRRRPQGNMDGLEYHYDYGNNQLSYVDDNTPAASFNNDIDDQQANNYQYDPNGRLIKDASESLSISWNLQDKVRAIVKNGTDNYVFRYNPAGNRILKKGPNKSTWYVSDANGNILATYRQGNGNTIWESAYLYGASRIGEYRAEKCLDGPCSTSSPPPPADHFYRKVGKRRYELSNHLGNILATVSDRKVSTDDGLGNFEGYEAEIVMAQDYFPFGMQMEDRVVSGAYRFGFNGQEKDDEILGSGNSYTAEYWQYDSRLGRRWNLDPKPDPSISEYATFINNPIWFSDQLGDTIRFKGSKRFNRRIKRKVTFMKFFGPKELRNRIRFVETDVQDIKITDKTVSGSSPTGGKTITLFQDKKEYRKINAVGTNESKGRWIVENEISALANEISHAYNQVSGNSKKGNSSVIFPKHTEIVSNEEVESNEVENMARGMFFWMPKRSDSHYITFSDSKKEARQLRRVIRIYAKNSTRGARIVKRKSADVQSDFKQVKGLYK